METELDPIETLTLQPVACSPTRRAKADPWLVRLRDGVALYIPLIVMAALSGVLWWLMQTSTGTSAITPTTQATTAPDYWLQDITMQRYNPNGQLLSSLEGKLLRHLPANQQIEIHQVSFKSWPAQGAPLLGSAQLGRTDSAGQDIHLIGDAIITRAATDSHGAMRYESPTLHYNAQGQIASSDRPVRLILTAPPKSHSLTPLP
jgi:lipopolysaccharide export system protein LptC